MSKDAVRNISTEQPATGVRLVRLDRPTVRNAISGALLRELETALCRLADETDVRAVVLAGAGEKAFASGADLRELRDLSPVEAEIHARMGQRVYGQIARMPQPVIAAVRGWALGAGLELALACDWIVAAEDAVLGLPETGLGLIPGFGGTVRLASAVGRARACELILTGRTLGALEARDLGLVARVVPAETVEAEALADARAAAQRSFSANAAAKRLLRRDDLETAPALEAEALAFGALFGGPDHREGIGAFLEKRPARFLNKP